MSEISRRGRGEVLRRGAKKGKSREGKKELHNKHGSLEIVNSGGNLNHKTKMYIKKRTKIIQHPYNVGSDNRAENKFRNKNIP